MNYFPGAKMIKITSTYRNSQELIDYSGTFVMKNEDQIKKELDHEKQITAIMCMVCPDHRLMRWKIEKLLRHGYPTEKIVKIVKGYCKGGEE